MFHAYASLGRDDGSGIFLDIVQRLINGHNVGAGTNFPGVGRCLLCCSLAFVYGILRIMMSIPYIPGLGGRGLRVKSLANPTKI